MVDIINLILLIGVFFIVAAIVARLKLIDTKLRMTNFRLEQIEDHFDNINQHINK